MNDIIAEVLAKFNFDQAAEVADLLDLYTTDRDELIETATENLKVLLSAKDFTYVKSGYFRASRIDGTVLHLEFIPLDAYTCGRAEE